MKKLITLLMMLTVFYAVNAQVEAPEASPFQKIEQKVGLTDITLEYSRPSMKGREIFGDLVPFGQLWRTGANKNTIVTFSDAVSIGGTEIKAGSYAVFTTPNTKNWEVVFYSDAENWGTPQKWDDSKVAAKVTADVHPIGMNIETFTMSFDDMTSESTMLGIMWEKTYVGVKIEVPTDKKVTASIDKVMSGPGAGDYYNAAAYYLNTGKDIKQAVKWIDMAIDMTKDDPKFWYLRKQSLILAKSGDIKGAIKAAKASLKGAEKAGNDGYIKMNKASLKEWE